MEKVEHDAGNGDDAIERIHGVGLSASLQGGEVLLAGDGINGLLRIMLHSDCQAVDGLKRRVG